ncbi:hypothetical protein HAX54_017774, partial [Datura stramonium]|nr:hypothetical protein [Datura stramonium]
GYIEGILCRYNDVVKLGKKNAWFRNFKPQVYMLEVAIDEKWLKRACLVILKQANWYMYDTHEDMGPIRGVMVDLSSRDICRFLWALDVPIDPLKEMITLLLI